MDCFLFGDFNFGDDDNDGAVRKDFVDCWPAVRPDELGYIPFLRNEEINLC